MPVHPFTRLGRLGPLPAAVLLLLTTLCVPVPAAAQFIGATPAPYPDRLEIRPVVSVGTTWFTAGDTFDAVLGSRQGHDLGGAINLTQGPAFIELGVRRFRKTGSRVFVGDGGEVVALGIPAEVTMTPLEAAVGWRFRPVLGRIRPYLGGGYTRLRYQETSEFADDGDNVDAWFNGFHLLAGAELRLARWVGVSGSVVWTSVRDAIGEGGVSQVFDERNLGGTSLRLSLVVGR